MQPIEGLSDKLDARNAVLLGAADLIERDGWCPARMRDSRGRHCAVGAILEVRLDTPEARREDLRSALEAVIGTPHIMGWNDAQLEWFGIGRRRVIRALREATKQPLTV